MADKVTWKNFRCTTCGAPLKAENTKDPIECVYCGNTIIPTADAPALKATDNEFNLATESKIRIEGIKTPSSALAFIEQFFEDYDWDNFAYAQNISIAEADKLVDSLKMTSADDKNTWIVAFIATFVPYRKKIYSCKSIIADIIEKYKENDLDAYSKFDAYKRVVSTLLKRKVYVVETLQKTIEKATKYGATASEIAKLNDKLNSLDVSLSLPLYSSIEQIPGIRDYIEGNNLKIANRLAAKGINAEEEYNRAKALINTQNYVEALDLLISLEGYSDSAKLAKKIDEYYFMDNVLEITGKRYFYKQSLNDQTSSLTLYPTEGDKISNKPLVKFIKKIITNYADTLYYIDTDNKLRRFSLSNGKNDKLSKISVSDKEMYERNRKVYILSQGEARKQLLEINLSTGRVATIIGSINNIILFEGSRLVYFGKPLLYSENADSNQKADNLKNTVNVLDVDKKEITVVGKKGVEVEGFIDNLVIYTRKAPTIHNLDLYVKELGNNNYERLIEKNIYEFREVFADKLLYDIGNSKNKTLIYANADGSERKEWALNIATLLFEQGGWVYFLRRSGYNSILCKAHIGDTSFSIIAKDVNEFLEIKNGYLYYKNFYSELIKVRMDGTNYQELCDDVKEVINIKEDSVVFVSVDEKSTANEFSQISRVTQSLYKVDFTGSGKRKLVYNTKNAKKFDDTTVYYTVTEKKESDDTSSTKVDNLYKIDTESGDIQKLLTLDSAIEKTKTNVFKYAMIAAIILFFIGFLCMIGYAPGAGMFFWFLAIICVVLGFLFKSKNGEKSFVDQIIEKVMDYTKNNNIDLEEIKKKLEQKNKK